MHARSAVNTDHKLTACVSASPRNDWLNCETNLQDLAVRVLRAGNHQSDWGGAGLMAGNRQGAAVEQIHDRRIA